MNVGPTERILPGSVFASGAAVAGAGGDAVCFAGAVRGGCDIRLARSSVTVMSPCSAPLEVSTRLSASAQLCPGARQLHVLSYWVRMRKAFGDCELGWA